MATSTCLGQIVLFPQVVVAIPPIRFEIEDVKEHIKPLFTLFVAAVAISLYTMFDKTLLGIMSTKESVAYYDYSNKIVCIPATFIGIASTVLYPKACQYAAVKDFTGMRRNMEKSLIVSNLIGFSTAFGLFAIADQFAFLYYGEEFSICGSIIAAMCPLILISGIGEAVRSQYIYPLKMDMAMVKIVSLNAIINLVLSATLIPSCGVHGAVIGSIVAEFTGLAIEIFLIRKFVSPKWIVMQCIPYMVIGLVMAIVVKAIGIVIGVNTTTEVGWRLLGIQVLVGIAIYCLGSILYMCFFKKEFLDMILKEIKQKSSKWSIE